MAEKNTKMLDVVVFGATGEAGRAVCAYLFHNAKLNGIKSWAPCARNLTKMNKILEPLLTSTPGQNGIAPSKPIVADSGDPVAMLAMTKQAKVVLACAGPFIQHGEGAVRACVEGGADYIDITGEMAFVEKMSRTYGEEAKKKKLRIISFGGYDSVPSDISVYMVAKAIQDAGKVPARIESFHRLGGSFMPAGTFNTVISISEKLKSKIISGVTFGMMGGGKKPTASKDAKKYEGPPFVPSEVRKFVKKSLGTNFKMLHSSIKQCSSAMHFMSGVNTPVVHTTAHAFGYSDIVYCERLTPLKPALSNLWGIIPACIVIACYLMAFFMTMIPGAMSLVTGYRQRNDAERLKMLDELMTKDFKSSGMVKVDCVGISKCGKTKAEVSFYSNHDAGLGFTAKSMVTVAGLIVPDARQEKGNGFGTAVATVGPNQIIAGLRKNGIGLDEAKVTTKK